MSRLAFEKLDADLLLATCERHGNVGPVVTARGEKVADVRVDVPYQLVTILTNIYPFLGQKKVAIPCRRCDEKALAELEKRGLIDRKRVLMIGIACSQDQAKSCRCSDPVPSTVDVGTPCEAHPQDELMARLLEMPTEDRLRFWTAQFRKCNKCFACTLTCPVCVCDECVLEERTFVPERGIPPGMSFHLIRGFHLSDKCVECGECERSCPAGIPLLTLRKMAAKDMKELYGFTTGQMDKVSPLLTTLEGERLEDECDEC